jgi:hypothetical protein
MPNKTLYVRESDLALWDLAQAQLGESVSALFAEFLRGRVQAMDAFVHVLRSAPNSQDFTVMFAPTGPSGNDGPMNPHYVHGAQQLLAFLKKRGVMGDVAADIASDLKRLPSVSVRTALPRSAVRPLYKLWFKPTCTGERSGAPRLLKVDVVGEHVDGQPASGGGNRWVASFRELDQLLNALGNVFGLAAPQLASLRRSLLSGKDCRLDGRVSGASRVVREEQLMQLGLVEEEPAHED